MTGAAFGPLMGLVLPVMQGAVGALVEFGVRTEVRILSAHRTPDEMLGYARSAADRGLKVIIAGAGGAAHLPGMLAAAGRSAPSPRILRMLIVMRHSASPLATLLPRNSINGVVSIKPAALSWNTCSCIVDIALVWPVLSATMPMYGHSGFVALRPASDAGPACQERGSWAHSGRVESRT
jgi:hypothetical protein